MVIDVVVLQLHVVDVVVVVDAVIPIKLELEPL